MHHESKGLNDFLERAPHFPNKSVESVKEFITNEIDPELDLIFIGTKDADGIIQWYSILEFMAISDQSFLKIYSAERGVSIKPLVLKYNGSTLFPSQLKQTPSELGMENEDVASVSFRPSTLRYERESLKESNLDSNKPKSKTCWNESNRKKSSLYLSPEEEAIDSGSITPS